MPTDLLRNISTIEQKTLLLGDISRFCAIYKVDEINFFDVPDSWKEKGFELTLVEDVLNYQATPQYLRKYRFDRRRTLNAVGLLHPLNTPNHPTEKEPVETQLDRLGVLFRQGVVLEITGKVASVDVGLPRPVELRVGRPLKDGQMVDVEIKRGDKMVEATLVEKKDIPGYWGYSVNVLDTPLVDIVNALRKTDVTIATSKHGITIMDFFKVLSKNNPNPRNATALFFGPRSAGLMQFFNSKDAFFAGFDHVVNCFESPGTRSIRLEEAIPVGLSLIDLARVGKKE